jgi:hypothetical protein
MLKYRNSKIIDNKYLIEHYKSFDKNELTDEIGKGDVGMIYKIKINNEMCALKLYKQYKNDIYAKIIKDIIINYKTNYLIEQNICPNFVYYYYSNVIMNKLINNLPVDYENLAIDKPKLANYYFVMEYCDGDLRNFFNDEHDLEIYKSCIFQICCAIYCLQKYVKIYHNDLSITNIIFKKIDKNIVFHYNINSVDYYVPTHGYLFVIIDFEDSIFFIKDDKPNHDFKDLITLHTRPIKMLLRKNNINTVNELLKLIKLDDINIKKIIDSAKQSHIYINASTEKIKDNLIYTKLYHESIKKKSFNYEKLYTKKTKKIVKLLKYYSDNIFTSKDKIDNLLYKHFTEFFDRPTDSDIKIISFNL